MGQSRGVELWRTSRANCCYAPPPGGEKRWISEERFLHALNFCMLLPGPEAHQLAIKEPTGDSVRCFGFFYRCYDLIPSCGAAHQD